MRAGSSTKSVKLGMSPECLEIKTDKESDLSSVESRGSDESDQSQEEVRYYNDNPQFPMLSIARRRFEAGEVLHVVSKDSANYLKCQCQPMRVQRSAAFLIDSWFMPLDDLPADGNRSYVYKGRSTHTYRQKANGKLKKRSSKRWEIVRESDVHFIREYRHHKDSPDFRQIIFYARDQAVEILNNTILSQYQFNGMEHPIKALPHGNAKLGKTFTRTKSSVKRALDENLKNLPTSEAVAKTRRDLGGPLKSSTDADIPRRRTQVYDMKRERSKTSCSEPKRKQIDKMTTFNWYAKTDGKNFVRMQELSGEPLIVLAMDKQLADLSRFCTSHLDFRYLSVDPKFSFGDFSVTPTSYRNLLLKTWNTNSVQYLSVQFSFTTARRKTLTRSFSQNWGLAPQLENLIAFGTDGETALAEALSENFPQAIHLRCFLHFRKNVESKLVSLGLPDHHQYFAEIFGKQEGIAYEKGLLDATSEEDFDGILASLSELWARREKSETSPFHLWILERSDLMKSCMIASVRTRAGLGLPPERCYTNDLENTNHPLWHKTHGKELGETALAKVMKELIEDNQETVYFRCIWRVGAIWVQRVI